MAVMVVAHPITGFSGRVTVEEFGLSFVGGFTGPVDVPAHIQTRLTGAGFTLNATPGSNYGGRYVLDEDLTDPESAIRQELSEGLADETAAGTSPFAVAQRAAFVALDANGKMVPVKQVWAEAADASTVPAVFKSGPGSTVDIALFRDPSNATVARVTKEGRFSGTQRVFNVLDYGADPTGVTASQTAINSAITAAETAGGGVVHLPAGTYRITAFISLRSKITLAGAGRDMTKLVGATGLTSGVVVGTSTGYTDITVRDMTIDAGFSSGLNVNGVQITNGARVHIAGCRFTNVGNSNVLFNNTPDSSVTGCHSSDSGQSGATGAHGILVSAGSHRCRFADNHILGARAMGIGFNGISTDCLIRGNYIENTPTATGFEAIGVVAGCARTLIANNHCVNSQDNGISCTAADSMVIGNIVEGALNHGIWVGGSNTAIIGNRVRNAGKLFPTDGLEYGGINVAGADCTIVGNVVLDDQATKTMSYGVKETAPADRNVIIGNRMSGFRTSELLRVGAATLAFLGTRPTITGSRGGNAALTSLLTALGAAGLVNDTTTA